MNKRMIASAVLCVLLSIQMIPSALAADTTYVVGVENLQGPFSHTETDGSLGGIAVEFLEIVEERSDLDLEIVEITDENRDMDFDITMLLEDDGTIQYQQSQPFLSVPLLLVQKESDNQTGEEIGILDYYGFDEAMLQTQLGTTRSVIVYDTLRELSAAFDDGEIYYMVIATTSLTYIQGYLKTSEYLSTPMGMSVDLTLRVAEGLDAPVMREINNVIRTLTQEELQIIQMRNAVAPAKEENIIDILQDNPELVLMPVAIALLVVLLIELRNRKRLADVVNIDPLTGLYTKHHFVKEAEKRLASNPNTQYTLLSIDFDNFKYINEIYGYEMGNRILKKMADNMLSIPGHGTVYARVFADKFLVLAETDEFEETMKTYEIGANNVFDSLLGESYAITISLGVYTITDPTLSLETMIDYADLGRSQGKGISETTVGYFSENMIHARSYNSGLVAGMEHGLAAKEFVVYYQPKVDLRNGEVCGAESLVRWERNGVLIPPNDFIPLFEQNRFIQKLDYYMFEQVCAFLKDHAENILPPISINFSGITIVKPGLVEDLMDIVNRYGVEPNRLDIEMTETALVEAHASALNTLSNLRKRGFTVSMDDFGVGVSSLTRLQNIPIDILKIDRGLVLGHMESEKGASILRNIFQMAQDLRVRTVAEGIETEEHLKFLMDYGCDYGQGFYFSKPLNETDFLALSIASKKDGWKIYPKPLDPSELSVK